MRTFLDTETRSRADLKRTGVHRYVEDEGFAILMLQYAVNDEPVRVIEEPSQIVSHLRSIVALSDEIVAHNAPFDRIVCSAVLGEYLTPEQWIDTRVIAAEHGYPGSLADLAVALGVQEKDSAGTRLINLFSKPNRSGKFVTPQERPSEWQQFLDYGVGDVQTLREVFYRLPKQSESERAVELADQAINDRGVEIDVDLATAAVKAGEDNAASARVEMIEITGVENPGSVQQLSAWFDRSGFPLTDLRAATVAEALSTATGNRRRVLELRQELSLSSHKKFAAALDRTCEDGRARGAFWYGGAHTLRWSGRGIQLQNLPRAGLGSDEPEAIERLVSGNGASPEQLKALVRAMILGPLTVADYGQIEARVLAWIAGEQWALDAFNNGRDIYVETAERMGGGMTRQEGKSATLGLGYGGTVQALRNVGGQGSESELWEQVNRWREANPRIVRLWGALNAAFADGGRVSKIDIRRDGRNRFLTLPSGRVMSYRDVRMVKDDRGRWTPQWHSPRGMRRMWGGLITENVVQATARDVLAQALVRLHRRGADVVGHVHDEVLVQGEYPDLAQVMCEPVEWSDGLPLVAEQDVMLRYHK